MFNIWYTPVVIGVHCSLKLAAFDICILFAYLVIHSMANRFQYIWKDVCVCVYFIVYLNNYIVFICAAFDSCHLCCGASWKVLNSTVCNIIIAIYFVAKICANYLHTLLHYICIDICTYMCMRVCVWFAAICNERLLIGRTSLYSRITIW